MRGGRAWRAGLAVLTVASLAGCGKKGPPLPPLRPVPVAVGEFSVERIDRLVTIHLTIPGGNTDGTTPAAVDRVELHALAAPAGGAVPSAAQVLDATTLVTTIEVRTTKPAPRAKKGRGQKGAAPKGPAPTPTPAPPPDPRPAPGDVVTYVDQLSAGTVDVAGAPVRYYAAIGMAGKRKGTPSGVVGVPLAASPVAPTGITVTPDEKSFTITWQGAANQKFHVYDLPASPGVPKRLSTSPLGTAEFTTPVEFGRERCFAVRAIEVSGRASVEGPASAPTCATGVDTYPPPAPKDLVAVPGEGVVDLTWAAVDAPDLAGYLVFRGEGANEILQPLMRAPITETTFSDKTVRAGVTYTYRIVALDKAGNPSERSAGQQVTAR